MNNFPFHHHPYFMKLAPSDSDWKLIGYKYCITHLHNFRSAHPHLPLVPNATMATRSNYFSQVRPPRAQSHAHATHLSPPILGFPVDPKR